MGVEHGDHGSPHAPGAPARGEAFPRHLTVDLVRADEERVLRRLRRVEWGLGLALACFALAFPIEALVGRGVDALSRLDAGAWSGPHLVPTLLAALIGRAGLGLEPAAFLISALALALTPPLAAALGRRLGAPPALATLGALALALTPAVWHTASLPGPDAPSLISSLALCSALLGGAAPRRVALLTALALLVDPALLWLLPAVLLRAGGAGRAVLGAPIPAILGALAVHALAAALDPGREFTALAADLGRAALGLDAHPSPWDWPAVSGLGALGVGLAGLLALVLVRRGDEEERPPAWLLVWCLAPLPAHVLGDWPPLWLTGPALLGALDLAARVPEPRAIRALALAATLQFGLLLATGAALRHADPLAEWRARARQSLRSEDVVLSAVPEHLHWLRLRTTAQVLDLRGDPRHWERLALDAARSGARLVLDGDPGAESAGEGIAGVLERLAAAAGLERL